MEEESLKSFFPPDSDLDHSFTSSFTSSSGSSAATFSARSSLSLPSFSAASSALLPALAHRRSDNRWAALRAAAALSPDGALHLRHLSLLRHLGSGHLARVFHCRLRGYAGDDADFALKVVDLDAVPRKDKLDGEVAADDVDPGRLSHVLAEGRVLAELDHPFLPTLYARLDASHYACFLIDYCPGGDLHALLRRLPRGRLPPAAVRFYAAEVLLALEYLHALGFVYRDLKPENVLLRADGHVMLSDFDLCFPADVEPNLLRRRRRRTTAPRRRVAGCFGGWSSAQQSEEEEEEELEFVAEPAAAYSRACVGTHEYLAPEVVSGSGHGNGVDWWAFGVFIYELLYGRTPFKGASKEATLRNIATKELRFPDTTAAAAGDDELAAAARDLISRLLVRDPRRRMGSVRGAAEIKRHPFFSGVHWPLIRHTRPPVDVGHVAGGRAGKRGAAANEEKRQRRGNWKWSSWNTIKTTLFNDNIKKKGNRLGDLGWLKSKKERTKGKIGK